MQQTIKKKQQWKNTCLFMALFLSFALIQACTSDLKSTENPHVAEKTSEAPSAIDEHKPVSDPLEPVNRAIFTFNDFFNSYVFSPVVDAYRFIVPEVVRDSVHNFVWNLKAPAVFANEVIQGDFENADIVIRRFAVNSTLGLGGLIDVASHHNLYAPLPEDMGQTLAYYGAGEGMYLVLPIFGPTTFRDLTGEVTDSMVLDPFNAWARNTDEEQLIYYRSGLRALDWAEHNLDNYNDLTRGTLDSYAATRSAYIQYRNRLILDGQSKTDAYDSYDAYSALDNYDM